MLKYRQKSVNKIDNFAVANEVTVEETLAREDDLLSTYSHQLSPPSKKRKPDDVDETFSIKVPTRNPFCLTRSNTDEPSLRPLTKTLSPVKRPQTTLSPMKTTPTKTLSPVKRANPKVEKRKLATTTLVLSRFFKKPAAKADKEPDPADNSKHIEIEENFLHLKSLYDNSVSNALSLYSDIGTVEPKMEKQERKGNSGCETSSQEEIAVLSDEIVEVISDTEEDQAAIKKTLNKFVYQKEVSRPLNHRSIGFFDQLISLEAQDARIWS